MDEFNNASIEDREHIMWLALIDYAVVYDREAISEFWQHCENLAGHITQLIALMERYGAEDGNIPPRGSSEPLAQKLYQRIESSEKVKLSTQVHTPLERIKKLGFLINEECPSLTEKHSINAEIRSIVKQHDGLNLFADQYVLVINTGLAEMFSLEKKCSRLIWRLLGIVFMDVHEFLQAEVKKCKSGLGSMRPANLFPTTAEWKRIRQHLWSISDDVRQYTKYADWATQAHQRRGRPFDRATHALLHWARSQNISNAELARSLVEVDLDREREGSESARIRRETKRLVTFLDNKKKAADRAASSLLPPTDYSPRHK